MKKAELMDEDLSITEKPIKMLHTNIPKFTWIVLLLVGLFDLYRGLIHTVFIERAISSIVQMNLTATNAMDQQFQLFILGISNLISGSMYIIVALKHKKYAEIALLFTPISHLIGSIGIRVNMIEAQQAFLGQYVMLIYMGVCFITYLASVIYRKIQGISNREAEYDKNLNELRATRIPKLTIGILFGIGIMDIIRGVLHTIFIRFAASTIAGFDFTDPAFDDLLQIMVAFGISNFATGMLAIIIAVAKSEYTDKVLLAIPIIYLVGTVLMPFKGITAGDAQLYGRYMMMVYFVICITTFIYTQIVVHAQNKKNA